MGTTRATTIGRFLCRDEAERRRLSDVGRVLRPLMPVLLFVFAVAGVSGVGTYGWLTLAPVGVAMAAYAVLWFRNVPRRGTPEYQYAAAFVFAEVMFALSILLAHGPRSYMLPVMAEPVLLIAVLFPRRVVVAGTLLAIALTLAVAFSVDLHEILATPAVILVGPGVLFSLALTALVVRDLDDTSRRSAFVDELTGALNRGALTPRLVELSHHTTTTGQPVGVIVGDIDHFKIVNDEHGHLVGDAVLRDVALRMSECVSAFEPVYRLGGEEFLVLLPGLDTAATYDVATAMWSAVRARPVGAVAATMSFGVAASDAGQRFDFDAIFARADGALYAAKQGGRDGVRVAPEGNAPATVEEAWSASQAAEADRRMVLDDQPMRARADASRLPLVGWTANSRTASMRKRSVSEELEREHILDLNERLRPPFAVIALCVFAGIVASIPSFGWYTLIGPVAAAVPYFLISRHAGRFRRPGLMLMFGWALFQASIAIGFVSARGAPLFALSLLILMVPGRCAVLRARGAALAAAYTGALMVAVAFVLDSSHILANPALLLLPLGLLVQAGYVGASVGRSAADFRGAGIVDELTGLLNRTALNARLLEIDAQPASGGRRVAVLLADVDHFKAINDRSGHAVGDAVLREMGARVRGSLRALESAYRIGGEEILILLPDTDAEAAIDVAQRLCEVVRSQPFDDIPVTISVGVAVPQPGEPFSYRESLRRADAALYQAKHDGRDRVTAERGPAGSGAHTTDPDGAPAGGVPLPPGALGIVGTVAPPSGALIHRKI